MGSFQYEGSGITSRWMTRFLCVVFFFWGGMMLLTSFERSPSIAQARYARDVAAAKADGLDPGSVPKPPESALWDSGRPAWAQLVWRLISLALSGVAVAAFARTFRKPQGDGAGD